MNQEPVAIVKLGGDVEWLTDVLPYNAKLYTHPAKTLTDEEIINIIERLIDKWTDEFKNYEYDSDESEENKLRDDVFAILRKAQK